MPFSELGNSYCGTITFDSNLSYEQKQILIQLLTYKLSKYLRHTKNSMYQLVLVREYHKVQDQITKEQLDDPEAPHYHFILYSKFKLSYHRASSIQSMLRDEFGRSQFFLMTTLKRVNYELYIQKDLEKNKNIYGYDHMEMYDIGPICDRPKIESSKDYLIYDSEDDL